MRSASAEPHLAAEARLDGAPLNVIVDMTSTVKYHDDAGAGRVVAGLGPAPDVVDAGVIGSGAMELSEGIPR